MTDLDPVALLSEVIGLRSVLGDSIARERAMAGTLTECQRRCTEYEKQHRAAHDALDEVTTAPRTLPLDERVRVALIDVLAAAGDPARCRTCNCPAVDHAVDDEERRECTSCDCQQYVAPDCLVGEAERTS